MSSGTHTHRHGKHVTILSHKNHFFETTYENTFENYFLKNFKKLAFQYIK